ncbi:MAG TPA: hypothetical protein VMZ71_10930, partial [Gemmataceae bacterium]|nr:hypothetical protein [Gemmataceae bacterium]
DKPGIAAGSYKVLVTKQKTHQGDMTPGSADYMKSMAQMGKETAKKEGGLFIPGATTGGTPVPKGELPQIYGSGTTTPFSATVPTSGPVNLDLKSEVKKK